MIDRLNAKHFDDEIPKELKDVYQEDDYKKFRLTKKQIIGLETSVHWFLFLGH